MNNNHQALWDDCLRLIRANVTEQQFKTWFAPIVFESYSEAQHTLLLQLPSMYVFEYLEQHYVGLLSKVLARVFGTSVKLNYRIVEVKAPQGHGRDITTDVESDGPSIETVPVRQNINKSPSMLDAPRQQQLNPQLDSKKSFNNYIEGASNKLPRTVGLSIAEHPGKTTFNPFFVYGPSGCGKTHLINAIGLRIKELHPELRVLYLSAHLFMVQYRDAILQNKFNDFIRFYQSIDVLIIDDVQELAGEKKAATQNTFFHIFNHLHVNGKQIILSADRPPIAMRDLEDRLLTRFKWGMQAEIMKPTQNLRLGILAAKVEKEGLNIPANVLKYIAENIDDSVRDLEGIINSLMVNSVVYNCDINMALVRKLMPQFVEKHSKKELTIEEVKQKVCDHFHVKVSQLDSTTRLQRIAYARQLAMYLANQLTDNSHMQIGRQIGNRNHSTVVHAIKQVNQMMNVEDRVREDVEELTLMLKASH